MTDTARDNDQAVAAGSILEHFGGSSISRTAQSQMWSWIPPTSPERNVAPESPAAVLGGHHATEQPSALFTTYTPPHLLSLTGKEIDDVLAAHADTVKLRSPGHAAAAQIPWAELPGNDRIMAIVHTVNAVWWRLQLEVVTAELLSYGPGDFHLEHTDMHPGSMQRKVSLSIQLSESDDYTGGNLELRCWGEPCTMPRLRGAVIAFPGWTPHLVTPVEAGERWSLVVWGWGRPVA